MRLPRLWFALFLVWFGVIIILGTIWGSSLQ